MSKFTTISATLGTGVTLRWGVGGIPITDAVESALLASIPPDVPKIPVLTKFLATDNGTSRGDGLRNASAINVQVKGFEQNIVVEGPGQFAFNNVRSIEAWRDNPDQAFEGQGFYLGTGGNNVTMGGIYSARNGWKPNLGIRAKNQYRHGIYCNEEGSLLLEDFILSENANVGAQVRRNATLRRGFIHKNSIGVLAVMGTVTIEDCVIYGGSWYVTSDGNWAGMVGLDCYSPVILKNVWIVGDGDMRKPGTVSAIEKVYSGGAVKCSKTHPQFPNTPGGTVQATDCVIAGWPTETGSGKWFSGDKPHDGSGFKTFVNPVVGLDAQVRAVLADIEANKVQSIAAASKQLRDLVRGAVK